MVKKEFIKEFAERNGFTVKVAEKAVDEFLDLLVAAAKKEGEVSFSKFGKFKIEERAARKGKNPKTQEEIDIPAKTVIKFAPAKALKERVNG